MGFKNRSVVLTGGGTAGHVTPNFALAKGLEKTGVKCHYIGMRGGMEEALVAEEGLVFYGINGGKLRRYLDFQNLKDVFKIGIGFFQALGVLLKVKPSAVFSKGGFVSCPVVWAAWVLGIPVVIHESDFTPGLANKLSMPFAKKVCYAFKETGRYLPEQKRVYTGLPIRTELLSGSPVSGRQLCGFNSEKPVVLITGGSQGSKAINGLVRSQLPQLMESYQICHIVGKGNRDEHLDSLASSGYCQFEYVSSEMAHLMAMADIVVSRAGATILFELLALKKPNILFPLPKKVSRGDQLLNATSFEGSGYSVVLDEECEEVDLTLAIRNVLEDQARYIQAMSVAPESAVDCVIQVLKDLSPNLK